MAGDHKCPVCNSTFTRPQHVARHMRSHTGDRPYKCQHCGDQFARSDLLSRHVNKCHASEKPPTTTAPNRRKGPTAASRATTSKQACDQCVQSSLPCDGCNPCSKCVQRKCRCTYVKFHRQTAPQGPGHPPPSALPPHHPHHSRASSSISSSMSAASMPGPSHPRMPDEFVLTPQPGTTSLSAMYSLPGVNTVAQMDYGGYGYAPQRESPTPSLSVSTSTRDSIDGSPEMIRYRAQNEYISRSNLGMGVDVSGMSNVGMSLLPNGTLMQSTGQGVLPGVYEHNQQQQSQNGRYWGSQSFQSEGGKEGLYGSGRLPFPTTNPNGTVTVQAHPSTHQSAQPHHPTGTHAVTSTHQQQQQQQQQSHHTSGEHHHPSPTFPSLSNLAFPSIHSTSTSSQYHHARGGSEDVSDGFGGGGEGSVPSSANSSNVHLPGMLDSPHIGGGSYYQDQGGKDSMIGGRGRGEQGEGGFSSAFGSMSLDDPNVIAGLSNDAPPFFSSLESNSSHASEQSSNTSSGSMHSHSTANTSHQSNVSQLNNNNSSSGLGSFGSSATTPGPLSLSSKEELKEFWKQYMRTPLTGPGVHSPLFPMMTPTASGNNLQLGASGAMGSGIGGDSTTRPTPSRRHSRVASMPSMKTPTPMSQLFMFTGVGSEASVSDMGGGGMMYPGPLMDQTPSNFKLYLNREKTAGSFKEPRPPRHQQQQNNQTGQKVTLHDADDLKSYEQAVLARKAPTHLNLVPKRRGTIHTTTAPPPLSTIMAPPNHTNSRVSSSSNTLPSVAAGMSTGGSKIGELMNRSSPSITASAASSSLADVFGSSRGTSSSASPDPGRSYYSANDNSPTIGSSLANSANSNTGSATLGGAQTSTVYRPSFKRLASQTLGPDNAKRALLGPAGWDEEDEDAIVDDEDWDVTSEDWERDGENASRDRARLPMRRMSCPTGSINGTSGGGVTLPPIYAGIMEANNGSSNAGARRGYPQ